MTNTIDIDSTVESSGIIPVFNPSNEEQIAEVPDSDRATVDAAVARARETFESGVWRKLPAQHRAEVMFRAAEIIKERTAELAEIEARDNGMNAMAAQQIIKVANEMLIYYAGWVGKIHGESANLISDGLLGHYEEYHTFTQLEPVGVVGLIIPWNGPFFVAMLKVAPALAAGCSAVLKPAEETPLSALKLEEIFREAGLPDGVLNVITGYGETTGALLTAHPDVDKIAFTGSTEVGRLIVKAAAGNLKRLTLELGGKSPLIMFDDANLDKAIMGAGMGLLAGSGQNCSCTSRMYVQRGIYDRVVEGLAAFAQMLPMGGYEDPTSVLGPLISEKQRTRVEGIVSDGVAGGAEIITGGKRMNRPGYFYEATIVTNTTPDMRLIREEIFGPVGCVIPFDEEEEAIAAANDTEYGLAGSIWTENLSRAHRVANALRGGQIWVNTALAADPSMPICGHKQSGWGGERGKKGLEAYFNTKSVYIGLT
ncbi:phenylacetaldehyde dehydrogenase [Mycolicibacterium insubricum]|uniref:Betaine-aldehyde dehydrogenase n=1 Tax=Mycolicibacterium insubricum TaxID=444597 RepID=A0A1X0DD82_9MYCO|nr:aldehyde dehydrogenase family protein [Mycolicibacterium insubricum]MCV7083975.1 aldehyde dehydrogenase [Mycolicibacterium insubricum]ORA70361.1 betaine-aldehyde dehydrogenase [Mycolicibacterium insubricum]BBZ67240.1 phenylacetaldehyde dehydrogenase [Mycolicibacterium insubricum]